MLLKSIIKRHDTTTRLSERKANEFIRKLQSLPIDADLQETANKYVEKYGYNDFIQQLIEPLIDVLARRSETIDK